VFRNESKASNDVKHTCDRRVWVTSVTAAKQKQKTKKQQQQMKNKNNTKSMHYAPTMTGTGAIGNSSKAKTTRIDVLRTDNNGYGCPCYGCHRWRQRRQENPCPLQRVQ
jgi:hypothetical protein